MLLSCGTSWVLLLPSVSRDNAISCRFRTDPFLEPEGPWAALRSLSRIGEALDFLIEACLGPRRDAGLSRYQLFDRLASGVDRYRRAADPAVWLLIDPMEYRKPGDDTLQLSLDAYPRGEVALAIMEGAALSLRRELEDGARLFASVNTIRMAGGPSESALWPQIIADILNLRVEIVHGRFSGAIGAAQIAASSRFSTSGPSDNPVGGIQRVYEPDRTLQPVYSERYQVFTARQAEAGQTPANQ